MSVKQKLQRHVTAIGGSIDWASSNVTARGKLLFIDAPTGHTWDWSESETLTVCWFSGVADDFYSEALEMVSHGCTEY